MGDFDEYDYLEKTVENPDAAQDANGHGGRGEDEHRSSKRRSNDDPDHRSKRSRAEEEHRSRRDDRDKERPREKDRERDRDRDREKERDRDKDRDRDRERDRDRGRDRVRERDRDGDKDRGRDRDRDHDREYRHKDKDKDRDRKHSKERREREKEKEKEAPAEPEADPERDQRTVFAYQINLKADERDAYEFFSRAGKVRDVRLIMDRNSRRSKGVGYIEYYDVMSVPMAIALSGQLLLGQPVMVKPSEAEKNLVQSNPLPMMAGMPGMPGLANPGLFMGPYSGGARRLYVGNLHQNMNEAELRQVFEPFGPVEIVQVPVEADTNLCKGYGFVQYARLEDARAAQQNLNGLELAGKAIKVTPVPDSMVQQDLGPPVTSGELDDDEGGGLSLNARSRAELMQKLDRSGLTTSGLSTSAVPAAPTSLPAAGLGMLMPGMSGFPGLSGMMRPGMTGFPGMPGLPGMLGLPGMGLPGGLPGASPGAAAVVQGEVVGNPTECLLLKNMFDPESEKEPDFELDIKEDVQEECSKFGSVKHIHVDGKSAGHVYIKFDTVASAQGAQRALHGRWFAGKTISAIFQTHEAYKAKFPES